MNPLTIAPDRLERLRGMCLGLPDATERLAWLIAPKPRAARKPAKHRRRAR
jgi:hypothetical protein